MEGKVKGITQPKMFSFEWKIQRFFADCEVVGAHYSSPQYPIQLYSNKITKWHLMVYPKGRNEQNKNWVSLFLYFDNENDIEVTVDFRLSISSEKGSWYPKEIKKHKFTSSSSNYGWFKFVELNFLKNTVNELLVDDTLTILCEITFHTADHQVTKNFHDYDNWIDKIENGFGDYEKLLENEKFSDVTFDVQNRKINAHKNILSCRSPVFSAMFEHQMRENKQNVVDITDIDYDVMKELFRFLYSGKVKSIEKIASDLLIAADKYQVIELKALCERTLYDMLTVDNVIDYLKLADMCDTIHLKRLVIKFTGAHFKEIVKKPGFGDLNSKVMHQIMLAAAESD